MAESTPSPAARDSARAPYRNLQQYVLDSLGRSIVAGEVLPGDSLPTEPQLAEEFGVSKTVIREAVRGLAAKGLVDSRPRVGTRVRDRDDWHVLDPHVLAWELLAGTSEQLLRDLDEFRSAVEPQGARLSALRAEAGAIAQVREAYEWMATSVGDPERYFEADVEFHARLLMATGNRMMQGLRGAVKSALKLRHATVMPYLASMEESLPYHEAVLLAVEARQPENAASAMESLMALTRIDERPLRGNA